MLCVLTKLLIFANSLDLDAVQCVSFSLPHFFPIFYFHTFSTQSHARVSDKVFVTSKDYIFSISTIRLADKSWPYVHSTVIFRTNRDTLRKNEMNDARIEYVKNYEIASEAHVFDSLQKDKKPNDRQPIQTQSKIGGVKEENGAL